MLQKLCFTLRGLELLRIFLEHSDYKVNFSFMGKERAVGYSFGL